MGNLTITNWAQEEVGVLELSDEICNTGLHASAVKDVVVQHLAKKRQGTHKAKTRAEVSGSGKKLYKQKGTGNARVGSAKSPLRRHGGVVFGPVPRSHNLDINKKVKKLALKSVIAQGVREQRIKVLEYFSLESHKTKELYGKISSWGVKSALFVQKAPQENFVLASRNIPEISTISISALNVYEFLLFDCVVFEKDALKELEKRLS